MSDPLRDYGFTPFAPNMGVQTNAQALLDQGIARLGEYMEKRKLEAQQAEVARSPLLNALANQMLNEVRPSIPLGTPNLSDVVRGTTDAAGAFGYGPPAPTLQRPVGASPDTPAGPAGAVMVPQAPIPGGISATGAGAPGVGQPPGAPPAPILSQQAGPYQFKNPLELEAFLKLAGPLATIQQQRIAGANRLSGIQLTNENKIRLAQLAGGIDLVQVRAQLEQAHMEYRARMADIAQKREGQKNEALKQIEALTKSFQATEELYNNAAQTAMNNALLYGSDAEKTMAAEYFREAQRYRQLRAQMQQEWAGGFNETTDAQLFGPAENNGRPAAPSGNYTAPTQKTTTTTAKRTGSVAGKATAPKAEPLPDVSKMSDEELRRLAGE